MKTSEKKISSSDKKDVVKEGKTSTGKKLIQAKLSFKSLSARTDNDKSTKNSNVNSSETKTDDNVSKKRKLNFNDNTEHKNKQKEIAPMELLEITISDEETNDDDNLHNDDSESNENSSDNSKNNVKIKTTEIKIKFPFKNKKRDRRNNDSLTSKSDDDESKPGPIKKMKKDEINDLTRKNATETDYNVIEVISDDEIIEDSDASLTDKNESNDKKNEKTKTEDNVSNEVEEIQDISKIQNENEENNSKNEEVRTNDENSTSDKIEDDIESTNSENLNHLINKTTTKTSSAKISKNNKISSATHSMKIKNSSVLISKSEFKKEMKKLNEQLNSVDDTKSNEQNDKLQDSCGTIMLSDNDNEQCDNDEYKNEGNSVSNEKSTSKKQSSSKLTPARAKKLQEMEKRRDERLKAKEEKEKKLQEEKDQKKKEKEEKELQRKKDKEEKEEQKRKEKEEKEEQKRKEKEEKEKKRLAEIEAKNEDRRQKEEEKRRKEQMKEDEKRRKEEAENKKRRAAEVFTKFFLLQKSSTQQQEEIKNDHAMDVVEDETKVNPKFMPFQVKGHMRLAPLFRRILHNNEKSNLDQIIADDKQKLISTEGLYLNILKSDKYIPGRDARTYQKDDEFSDVVVLEDELEGAGQAIDGVTKPQKYKAKFLYFRENRRPPYYGTWRKKSKKIGPRKPFGTDATYFDYEIDSDDEWEEEEPGESLNGSDDDKDKESEDDYEIDNEFFVPHGHLSEEEMQNEEEDDNSPETQKAKMKLSELEFAQEMKKKTEKIKPKLVGIVWQDENGNKPDVCPDIIWSSLNKRAMIFSTEPFCIDPPRTPESESNLSLQEQQNKQKQKKKITLPTELVKDLIRLVHGNTQKKEFLIKEFQAYVATKKQNQMNSSNDDVENSVLSISEYSKAFIRKKIDEMAAWTIIEENVDNKIKKKLCWTVGSEYLKKYNLENLSISNKWSYILEPKKRLADKIEEEIDAKRQCLNTDKTVVVEEDKKMKQENKSFTASIKKFTKIVSKEEKEKQSENIVVNAKLNNEKCAEERMEIVPNGKKIEESKNELSLKSNGVNKSQPTIKKRVPLLLSVPRGQQISQSCKDKLLNDFFKKNQSEIKKNEKNEDKLDTKTDRTSNTSSTKTDNNEDIIIIN